MEQRTSEEKESRVEKTVIITGPSNGGTSIVAAIVRDFGVYLGNTATNTIEDRDFAMKLQNEEKLLKYIDERNSKHPVWGLKRPNFGRDLEYFGERVYNPYVVAIFRDPVAVEYRYKDDPQWSSEKMVTQVAEALRRQQKILEAIDNFVNVHVMSYEKLLVFPEREISELARFIGKNTSLTMYDGQIDELAKKIRPENGHPPM